MDEPERVYSAYCESTKTCTWKRERMPDKEALLEEGKAHAIAKHPEIEDWRVRVMTIRVRASKKKRSPLWR